MKKTVEIWADSFHEGNWCCSSLVSIAEKSGFKTCMSFANGFVPVYKISKGTDELELIVYGSYRSWTPLPQKIDDLLNWGKPDFIAFDSVDNNIIFAVEETAATPTGNQAMQRCERQYGSARAQIPYWYLISEYGMHRDGGIRRDSIWPTIAAIKLSILKKTPCIVLHYSDIDNPEDYNSGTGVYSMFSSLFLILLNHLGGRSLLSNLDAVLQDQYKEMLSFIQSQWESIIDFLPGEDIVADPITAEVLTEIATGNTARIDSIDGLLEWPIIKNVPYHIREGWTKKALLKYDPLCAQMEQDIQDGKAYYLSDNAGSGRPPTSTQIKGWIREQKSLFQKSYTLSPPAVFSLNIEDFPDTGNSTNRHHVTTSKNIVYLYDSWNMYILSLIKSYPRLGYHLQESSDDIPVFVYVSNSIKPGRLFGDPFTGQIAAYATAFGKFDKLPRKVVAYFPHQVHTQAIQHSMLATNKGITLLTELTDFIIFHAGVLVNLREKKVC
jgi:hypothetical protein